MSLFKKGDKLEAKVITGGGRGAENTYESRIFVVADIAKGKISDEIYYITENGQFYNENDCQISKKEKDENSTVSNSKK